MNTDIAKKTEDAGRRFHLTLSPEALQKARSCGGADRPGHPGKVELGRVVAMALEERVRSWRPVVDSHRMADAPAQRDLWERQLAASTDPTEWPLPNVEVILSEETLVGVLEVLPYAFRNMGMSLDELASYVVLTSGESEAAASAAEGSMPFRGSQENVERLPLAMRSAGEVVEKLEVVRKTMLRFSVPRAFQKYCPGEPRLTGPLVEAPQMIAAARQIEEKLNPFTATVQVEWDCDAVVARRLVQLSEEIGCGLGLCWMACAQIENPARAWRWLPDAGRAVVSAGG